MAEKRYRLYRIVFITGSLLYFSFLLYAVFFARRRRHLSRRYLNLTPIQKIIYEYHHMEGTTPLNYYSNLFGNVLVFIPIPFILMYFFHFKKFLPVVLTGFLISFTIEALQYLFEVGVADVDDLILNTLGTIVGYYCYLGFRKLFPSIALVHAKS